MAKIADAFYLIRNGANIKQGLDDSGYPITRIETISNRTVDRSKMGYAGVTDVTKYSDFVLQDGDILMSHINSETHLGKVAHYKKKEEEIIIHGMNLLCLRPRKELVDSRYAFYYLSSEAFLRQIPRITKKSVNQASFNVAALKELIFPIPTMETQKKVVSILDKANELIAMRKEQLAKLDQLVKSGFIELFGDPKYNKTNLVKIGEIGALTSGGTPSRAKPEYFEGDIRWYSAGELNSLYLPDSVEHISEAALQQSSAKLFNKGTLMIGMYDTAAFKMGILTENSSSNQACANLNPQQGYNIVWLYYLFDIMKPIFLQERQGVRQKNLSLSKIKEFEVPCASFELQDQFAAFVEQTDKSKLAIQQSLDKLETLKKALMQKYFE